MTTFLANLVLPISLGLICFGYRRASVPEEKGWENQEAASNNQQFEGNINIQM